MLAEDYASAVTARLDVQKLLTWSKPAQADVIRLVKLDGFTIEEASPATGQSIALIKVNIHPGIVRLSPAPGHAQCHIDNLGPKDDYVWSVKLNQPGFRRDGDNAQFNLEAGLAK